MRKLLALLRVAIRVCLKESEDPTPDAPPIVPYGKLLAIILGAPCLLVGLYLVARFVP